MISNKRYIKDQLVPTDEDLHNEHKGHRSFAFDEIPRKCVDYDSGKKSRAPLSRTICGFLNTGKGGVIYLGVTDDGIARGLKLTPYQMDHISFTLQDTLNRFTPAVPQCLYELHFCPLVPSQEYMSAPLPDPFKTAREDIRGQRHLLRTPKHCWCDIDCEAQFNLGILPGEYIVEIHVHPWDPENPMLKPLCIPDTPLHPYFETEENLCFIRSHGCLMQPSHEEIIDLTRNEVRQYFQPKIEMLENSIAQQTKS